MTFCFDTGGSKLCVVVAEDTNVVDRSVRDFSSKEEWDLNSVSCLSSSDLNARGALGGSLRNVEAVFGVREGDWVDEDDQIGDPLTPFLGSFRLGIEAALRMLVLLLTSQRKSLKLAPRLEGLLVGRYES